MNVYGSDLSLTTNLPRIMKSKTVLVIGFSRIETSYANSEYTIFNMPPHTTQTNITFTKESSFRLSLSDIFMHCSGFEKSWSAKNKTKRAAEVMYAGTVL